MKRNQDISGRLISAVREGSLETVKELVSSFGLSCSEAWSNGYVLLRDALMYKHTDVAKLLLTSGSKVNSNNKQPSDTPLHFAAKNGDIELARMIIDKGGYVNAKNKCGRTPLYDAIENKKIQVCKLLLMNGAYVTVKDEKGLSPLHIAVEIRCIEIVEDLLNRGADVNSVCSTGWNKCYTLLHFAVEKNSKEITMLLLKRGADVNVRGEDDITPLHIAVINNCLSIAEDLLNHGACIHSLTLKEGYMPLHFAAQLGNEDIVKLFLNCGADANAITKDNLSPLYIAARGGHKSVIKLLLKHGADVDNTAKDGETILYHLVKEGYLNIVKGVLECCPDINNKSNRSSLKTAVLGYGKEYKNIVQALLEYGLIVNPEDANYPELLYAAVEHGYLKIVEDLLKHGADSNTLHYLTSKEVFTPLHIAAKHKREEIIKLLINYGANINAEDKTRKTPIFYAIENADLKITKLLLINRANVKNYPKLLNMAVRMESIEIVEALLEHDANINASDSYGLAALHYTAIASKVSNKMLVGEDPDVTVKVKIARLLLSKGANADVETKNGITALHFAVQEGYTKVVEALLEYNASVNCLCKSDLTPLHFSARKGNEKITTMLLNKGANVNAMTENGMTALHAAAQRDHRGVVKILLQYGAKANSKIKSGIAPLHLGAKMGYQEIIETLLKFGADINSRDEDGRTALHIASQNWHKKAVETLLEYGADINSVSRSGLTPLDYVLTKTQERGIYRRHAVSSNEVAMALKCHIIKMKAANLYVSEQNLSAKCSNYDFEEECVVEIVRMKSERINNTDISFYDILARSRSSVAIYLKDKNILDVLNSDNYKTQFPIYASMIKCHFRKGMERNELLEQSSKTFHFLFNYFPELPYDCTEKVFSYMSNEDLRNFNDCL